MSVGDRSLLTSISHSKGMRGGVFWMLLFTTFTNLLLLVIPLYMTQVYDRVLPSSSVETLVFLTIIACGGLFVFGCIESVRQIIAQRLSSLYEFSVMPKLIMAASDGHGAQILSETSGSIGKVGIVKRFIASGSFTGLFDLPFAPLFLGLMFLAHPVIGWATVGGIVLLVLVTFANQRIEDRGSRNLSFLQGKAMRHAGDALRQSEEIRAMGMGFNMVQRWSNAALAASKPIDSLAKTNASFYGMSRFVRQSIQVLVLGAGAWLVITGKMSASLIFAASLVSSRALMPVEQVVGSWRQINEALMAFREVDRSFTKLETTENSRPLMTLPEPVGRLEIRQAAFSFSRDASSPALFQDVSLVLQPGQIAALVGPSGSGKSTLARIAAATMLPTAGEILLDGFPLRHWPSAQRGASFGYMGQESILHEGTVAENIGRFGPSVTDEAVLEAAMAAGAHSFIATLPDGYSTRVGAGGLRLSGGQIQRIALARAFFGSPKVLVLDEPNSHLDSMGETVLTEALVKQRARGCAILMVTHRNRILSVADQVYMMEKGKLTAIAPRPTPGRVADVHMVRAKALPASGAL